MCKTVQHPTKGLFLRYYLLESFKDKLPDLGMEEGGKLQDSVEFLVLNFIEMNKLMVRLTTRVGDQNRKIEEQKQLFQLVGI